MSNPASPGLLWQRGTTSSGVLLGNSDGAAITVLPASQDPFQSEVILTSGTPTGPSGIAVTALWGPVGSQLWQWSHT